MQVAFRLEGHCDRVTRVACSCSGDAVLSAFFDASVKLWEF